MLNLTVRHHKSCRNIHYALRSLIPQPLLISIGWSHPRRPSIICHLRYAARDVACLARHDHRFPRVRPEADPAEAVCEDVKCLLQPLHLGQRDDSFVRIKIGYKVLHRHAKVLRFSICCRYHHQPVVDVIFHYHVEGRGVHGISLGYTAVALEGRFILAPGLIQHVETAPERR